MARGANRATYCGPGSQAHPESIDAAFHTAARFSLARLGFTAGTWFLYILIFIPAHRLFGNSAGMLAMIPLATTGWFWGVRGGLLLGLLQIPLQGVLFEWAAQLGWGGISQPWLGAAAGLVTGLGVGGLTDALNRRKEEINRRREREEALRRARDDLEVRVQERTAELARAGENLRNEIAGRQRAEGELRESQARYRTLTETAQELIFVIDRDLSVEYLNAFAAEHIGCGVDQVVGKPWSDLLSPEAAEKQARDLRRVFETGQPLVVENRVQFQNRALWLSTHWVPMEDASGAVSAVLGVSRDLSERKQMEDALRENEERYVLAARGSNDGLWDWNLKTDRIYYSPRWKAMLGCAQNEIRDEVEEWFQRVHPDDIKQLRADLESHLEGHTAQFESEHRMLHADGRYRWMLSRGLAVRDGSAKPYRMAGSQTDISRRKMAEERLLHDALHEPLTGLPNRALFMDRLSRRLKQPKRGEDGLTAVLFLDLDRFKIINDSLGHLAGDELLIAVACRLETCVRAVDTVARFGGDEFAILLEDRHDASEAILTAMRIQSELGTPFRLDGHILGVSASIGIALSSDGTGRRLYDCPEDLLRNADTAMYRAKALGKARYEVYDPSMHRRALALLNLEADLRQAVEQQEFRLYYQPVVSLASGKITSVEALLRWQHPRRGLVLPVEFIALAEETGLILPIGEWALRIACAQTQAWREAGETELQVAVNFSARQFLDPHLPALIRQVLAETALPAQALQLEITESTAMQDIGLSLRTMHALCAIGVQISIDDFGNYYSAIGNLKRFPFKALKIDRSFVQDIERDRNNAVITTAIIAMARSLKLRVIAEGVETDEQREFLRQQECDEAQGDLFSRPIPGDALTRLLHQGAALALPG